MFFIIFCFLMIDLKKVYDNLDEYRVVCKKKNSSIDLDLVLDLDIKRKELQSKIDETKSLQKKFGNEWAYDKAKELKVEIQSMEKSYSEIVEKLDGFVLQMPNFIRNTVPVWKDDTENVVVKIFWDTPNFDFEVKDHMELMKKYDMVDIERGVKLAWSRSYFLKWDGALLENAILQYSIKKLREKWFTFMTVPHIVNYDTFKWTGYFPGGEEDAYWLERDDKWLIATSEIPLTSYHSDEILSESDLPLKYVGSSPCYRREAWTYGKDTYGLYRIHQFNKVEQVVILPADEELSNKYHAMILQNSMDILDDLWLPYRVLQLCTGDLALWKYDSHDLECWMPSRDSYGETHSVTSFLDFQARRLNLRYRDDEWKIKYCYTMNNTVVASPRILIPLIENNQTKDWKIVIPKVLRPYMDQREYIG